MGEKPIKEEESVEYSPANRGQKLATVLLAVGLCGVLTYTFLERRSAKQIAASRDELRAALNQTRVQVETLNQKLMAMESAAAVAAAPALQPSLNSQTEPQVPVPTPKRVPHRSATRATGTKAQPAEDPWRKEVQSQLAEQQKLIADDQRQIQETKDSVQKTRMELESNLQSTRDDLNTSIAKNHEELVALEKKGERNYYEFDLQKAKQFQRVGPMSISLRKSDTKHEYCDLAMILNDAEVSKKHVNLYEPVLFYPEAFSQPVEVVINSIGKDAARGYVSEPKYKPPQLATSASSSAGTASGTAGQSAPTSSLEAGTLKRRPGTQE
jgi:uncharacterized coiled-coil protein SlyX